MEKVRYGIIGLGNQGSSYMYNIFDKNKIEGAVVSACCDNNPAKIEAMKAKTTNKDVVYFADYKEMLDSGLVDAVLVEVPHYQHPEMVMECLKRGVNVVCEKPAGVYTKQVREMIAVADQHPELTFGMMFNQRTNCVYRKMREILQSGELGQIRRTSWIITNWYRPQSYYDSGAWRATWSGEVGGVLLNQCPHQLDLWQWICGMPVTMDVKMHFGKWHDIEVEDDVTAYCTYANGATGTFITSTGDTPGSNRFEIVCDGGTLLCDGKEELVMYKLDVPEPEFTKTYKGGFGHPNAERIVVETDGENPQHVGVLNAFAAHILRGEPLVADGREGINGLTISNAMHLSAWLGQEVKIPFDEDLYYDELMKRVATSRRKVNVESVVADTEGTY